MSIRIRTILVIFSTMLVIISFSVFVGIFTVTGVTNAAQEADLRLVSDIADNFISSEIKALKSIALGIVQMLSLTEDVQWAYVLESLYIEYPEFIGMTVWDLPSRSFIASAGRFPAQPGSIENEYIQQVILGNTVISSTVSIPEGTVFYLTASLPEMNDTMLTLTLSYMYFSDLLSNFKIWETGHIFMDDSNGFLVANPRPLWVETRIDFTHMAQIDQLNLSMVNNIRQGFETETRIVNYSISGVPRLCVYRSISGSEEGWVLGVVSPLPESPFRYIDIGLVVVGIVSLFLSLIAALVASGFIKKPFEKIAALKEVAEAASKFKSDFLANMSHEIRTPMNAVLGVTEIMMQSESLSKENEERLEKIYTSCDMLMGIINDILDFSKIEAGKLEIKPYQYYVASLINDSIHLNMMRIGEKPIKFELIIDENIPAKLVGDELRIKQIMNNILSNAFKYTEAGKVTLTVSSEPCENGIILVVSVKDSGRGMTPEQLEELFDEYSRFNEESGRTIEGTGLGLSITLRLLNLMGGKIEVESKVLSGSLFTIRLPQETVDSEVLGKELTDRLRQFRLNDMLYRKRGQITRDPMPYGKVLIVDDVEANLYVAEGLLKPYKLQIDSVMSGFDAIDKISEGDKFDIIFMDHMMPGLDGIETTKRLRSLGYSAPIIALTANAVVGQADIFLENGFDDFIAKPIDVRQLNAVLNKMVRDKQPLEVVEAARKQIGTGTSSEQQISPHLQELLDRVREHIIQGELDEAENAIASYSEGLSSDSFSAVTAALNREIDGLDIVKGLEKFNGDIEIYLKLLRSYTGGVRSLFDLMEAVCDENMSEYRRAVHSIKGTSLDILAVPVGKKAAELEDAAKVSNLSFIKQENPAFLVNVRKLVDEIDEMLSAADFSNTKPKKDKIDTELLEKLLVFCEDYDMDGVDTVMAEIGKYTYESDGDLLESLWESVNVVDFEGVAEKLSGYKK